MKKIVLMACMVLMGNVFADGESLTSSGAVIASSGAGLKTINTSGSGTWTATTDSPGWIELRTSDGTWQSQSSGEWGKSVYYRVLANNQVDPRVGKILVGSCSFTVTQEGCKAELDVTTASYDECISKGTVQVSVGETVKWSVKSNCGWLRVDSAASYVGSGTVEYTVAANNTLQVRKGTIMIAGTLFEVTQSGVKWYVDACDYACDAGAHSVEYVVETLSTTAWTISSDAPWISFSNAGRTGSARVSVKIAQNTTAESRVATVTFCDRVLTIEQKGQVASACSLAISPESYEMPAAGGLKSFNVSVEPSLAGWEAESLCDWLSIRDTGTERIGSGTAWYNATKNLSLEDRDGAISVLLKKPLPSVDISRGLSVWKGTSLVKSGNYNNEQQGISWGNGSTECVWFKLKDQIAFANATTSLFRLNDVAYNIAVDAYNQLYLKLNSESVPLGPPLKTDVTYGLFVRFDGSDSEIYIGQLDSCRYAKVATFNRRLGISSYYTTGRAELSHLHYYYWNRCLSLQELCNHTEYESSAVPLEWQNVRANLTYYSDFKNKTLCDYRSGSPVNCPIDNAQPLYEGRHGQPMDAISGMVEHSDGGNVKSVWGVRPMFKYSKYETKLTYNGYCNAQGRVFYRSTNVIDVVEMSEWPQELPATYADLSNAYFGTKCAYLESSGSNSYAFNMWIYSTEDSQNQVVTFVTGLPTKICTGYQYTYGTSNGYSVRTGYYLIEPTYYALRTLTLRGGMDGVSLSDNTTRLHSTYALQSEVWHMVTLTANNGSVSVFVDGEKLGSVALKDTFYQDCFRLGGSANLAIDEVGVWNRALTETEIKYLYSVGKPIERTLIVHQGHYDATLSDDSFEFDTTGGSGTIDVTLQAGVPWCVEDVPSWIRIVSDTQSTGPGKVMFEVAANASVEDRSAAFKVAGKNVLIRQMGAGDISDLLTAEFEYGPAWYGEGGSEDVGDVSTFRITPKVAMTWQVSTEDDWILIDPPYSGTEGATLYFLVSPTLGVIDLAQSYRLGKIDISGFTLNVFQRGYEMSASPNQVEMEKDGGTGEIAVTAPDGCEWKAVSESYWIRIMSESEGTGSGALTFEVDANTTGKTRTGRINVCGEIVTVVQARYSVAVSVEGHGRVAKEMRTDGKCVLTATPDAGYAFVEWSGDVTGTESAVLVDVLSNIAVVARFSPLPPQNANVMVLDGEGLQLTWDRVDWATAYYVYRSETAQKPEEPFAMASAEQTSYLDEQGDGGQTYHYWVEAVSDVTGESASAAPQVATMPVFVWAIEILGPRKILTNKSVEYACQANLNDGTTEPVEVVWTIAEGEDIASLVAPTTGETVALSAGNQEGVALVRASFETTGGKALAATRGVSVCDVSPAAALGLDGQEVRMGGDADWDIDFEQSHEGSCSLRFGSVDAGQISEVSMEIKGAGTVSFWWRSSTADDNEVASGQFLVDGKVVATIGGATDWTKVVHAVETWGQHVLSWRYGKGQATGEMRDDCIWLGNVSWNATAVVPVGIAIEGPASMLALDEAQYSAFVHYNDGTSQMTQANWLVVAGGNLATIIGSTGMLYTKESDGDVSIRATVQISGQSFDAEKNVSVRLKVVGLEIVGPTEVSYGSSAVFRYQSRATYSDGSTKDVQPSWSAGGRNISADGVLTAVCAEQLQIEASYEENGVRVLATPFLVMVRSILKDIEIEGPDSFAYADGRPGVYSCTATYSDGMVESVVPTWEVAEGKATVFQSAKYGILAPDVGGRVLLKATYSFAGVVKAFVKEIEVIRKLVSIEISGPDSLKATGTGHYVCTAVYDDGSTREVTPTWKVTAGLIDIGADGTVTPRKMSGELHTEIQATYSENGITKSEKKVISVTHEFVSLEIIGPDVVALGKWTWYSIGMHFDDERVYGGGAPVWKVTGKNSTIDDRGYFYSTVAGEVTIQASCTYQGVTKTATKVVKVCKELVSVTVIGPLDVAAYEKPTYRCQATYSDGSVADVNAQWETSAGIVSTQGVFDPMGATQATLTATYEEGDVQKSASVQVVIRPWVALVAASLSDVTDVDKLSVTSVVVKASMGGIPDCMFKQWSNVVSVVVEEGVTSIGNEAFMEMTALKVVDLPGSISELSYRLFSQDRSLESVRLGWGIANVADGALLNCEKLEELTFPSSVTNIDNVAMGWCMALQKLTFEGNAPHVVHDNILVGTPNSMPVCVKPWSTGWSEAGSTALPEKWPVGSEYARKIAWYNPEMVALEISKVSDTNGIDLACVTSVVVKAELGTIPNNMFSTWPNLVEATIEDGVSQIGTSFYNCPMLRVVRIPSTVKKVGHNAFAFCGELRRADLPDGITEIQNCTFSNCTNLESTVIPDSVRWIGEYAYIACTNLREVTVGAGVTNVGKHAINGCTSLTNVIIKGTVTTFNNAVFQGCASLKKVTFLKDAPLTVGDNFYSLTPSALTTYVSYGSTGWSKPGSTELPAKWPVGISSAHAIAWFDAPEKLPELEVVASGWSGTYDGKGHGVTVDVKTEDVTPTIRYATSPEGPFVETAPIVRNVWESGDVWYEVSAPGYASSTGSVKVVVDKLTDAPYRDWQWFNVDSFDEGLSNDEGDWSVPSDGLATVSDNGSALALETTSEPVLFVPRKTALDDLVDEVHVQIEVFGCRSWLPDIVDGTIATIAFVQEPDEKALGCVVWTKDGWLKVSASGVTPHDGDVVDMVLTVDYAKDPALVSYMLNSNVLADASGNVRFPVLGNKRRVSTVGFSGTCAIEKMTGTLTDPSRACAVADGNGVWTYYTTLEAAQAAAGGREIVMLGDVSDGVYVSEAGITVPASWLAKYPAILSAVGGDRAKAVRSVGANGKIVWECYVADLDPTNPESKFRAIITIENGEPKVTWVPDLGSDKRTYRTFGTRSLGAEAKWDDLTGKSTEGYHFFKVTVELPK